MVKVSIKDLSNTVKFSAEFATTEQANEYIDSNKIHFGKPARYIPEFDIEKLGENINQATGFTTETINEEQVKVYHFNATYLIETQDISYEHSMRVLINQRALKRSFGEALIDKISTINDSKNLSVEQVDAFMTNALISNLREHLWAGNIDTFISKLQSSDVSAFFTAEEKAAVILECQTFLTNLGG